MDLITTANSWSDFEASLSSLGNTEKGRAFEELTRLHLLTDPTFSTKIDKIWHHSDVPQKIVDELGLQRPEIGVDLVAQVKDGTYWAIQCKFHQDRSRNVTYEELSTFFSITERDKTYSKLSHRLVCTSANGVSHKVDKAHPKKLGYLTSLEFSKLGQEEFNAFRELLGGGHPAPTPYDPRDHQKIALEKVDEFFKETKNTRGKIIHPCGSGKSLTGYWISQALKSKNVIIAVPSLALVRQTLGSWTREAVANKVAMDWIAVCSDDDVKNSDDPSMHKVDLGIEVDTDPEVIAEFLSKSTEGTKVLITTYQSGHAVSEAASKAGITFDLGIYDEAHKTVGQKDKAFAHLLYDENVKVAKRVFMTATERQFKGNSDEYLSMDDETIYGKTIHELSFKAALEQDPPILSDYKIVSTIVTKSEIDQLINSNNFVKSDGKGWSVEGDASTLASMIALRKLVKERDIKHVVSFHSSIARSKEFMNLNTEASKADSSFGDLSSFHVSGKDSTGVRAAELERFVDAEPSLITNARCLTEGVDVPAIDAILFADPKQSKIDIVQAAGRALRKFDGKDFGYIIVPVVLDEYASDPSDKAFEQIITVISALGMNDERIIEEFKEIAAGRKGRSRIVDFDVPEIVRVRFEDFLSNVEIQIWDRLSFGWYKGFEYLKQYVEEHGNSEVPYIFKCADGFNLGSWVGSRRMNYNKGVLKQEKIYLLENLPKWTWDTRKSQFEAKLEELDQYVTNYGHSKVPSGKIENADSALGQWVSRQRDAYQKGTLPHNKIRVLEEFPGWTWDALEEKFMAGLIHLRAFVVEHGHSRVPNHSKSPDGYSLGVWISTLRKTYSDRTLTNEKIEKLECLPAWAWDPKAADLDYAISQLRQFVDQFGHPHVPQKYKTGDGFNLGSWVTVRRSSFRKGTLDSNTIRLLENFSGWSWDPLIENYLNGLLHLRSFVEKNGHSLVPYKYEADDFNLGSWVVRIRQDYKKGQLDQHKINELQGLYLWTWNTNEQQYLNGLSYLKKFVQVNGHSRVTGTEMIDGFSIGRWVSYRRVDYRDDNLSGQRISDLENFPKWTWDPIETQFVESLHRLKQFAEDNGHTKIPVSYCSDDGFKLGQWVKSRRRSYKTETISADHIKKIESISQWKWQKG